MDGVSEDHSDLYGVICAHELISAEGIVREELWDRVRAHSSTLLVLCGHRHSVERVENGEFEVV